jgi:hypothetical protein
MAVDETLQYLVRVVNIQGERGILPITLSVHGLLFSGNIISAEEWRDALSRFNLASIQDPDTWSEAFQAAERARHTAQEPDPTLAPVYVHLRDTVVWHPGGSSMHGGSGGWWRIRLDQVDGFMLGALPEAAP